MRSCFSGTPAAARASRSRSRDNPASVGLGRSDARNSLPLRRSIDDHGHIGGLEWGVAPALSSDFSALGERLP